jgi:hypothetical protein
MPRTYYEEPWHKGNDAWRKDMPRCRYNDWGECIAQTPVACICIRERERENPLDSLHPRERSLVERVMAAHPDLTFEEALAALKASGM